MDEAIMILRFRYFELAKAISDHESGLINGDGCEISKKIIQVEKALKFLLEKQQEERNDIIKFSFKKARKEDPADD